MCRIVRYSWLLGVLLCLGTLFENVGFSQSSNTWSPAGKMIEARTGAAEVLLQNGQILITGGLDANGVPVSSAEFYDPLSGTFSVAPSMMTPRANHSAIVLSSGDVLVTGGRTDVSGDYTNSAEIFDAAAKQWKSVSGSLPQGLANHVMCNLADDNVLIAGGTSTVGPVNSLLLYIVSAQSFSPIATLLQARSSASAAAVPDGRLLIAGGTDINGAVLASTEIFIYDPANLTGSVSAGPSMSTPRMAATATATYDGVAIIGGNNGETDLTTAEIFSQWTNSFRTVSGARPRSGHFAVLLPGNGAILAMGGTGGQSVDLLQPWANSMAGGFVAAADSLTDQTGGYAAPASLGSLLATGGKGEFGASAELYGFPTIATDQSDYPPGTTVVMTGTGFKPGEIVDLHLHEWVNQKLTDAPDYQTNALADGRFTFTGYAPVTTDLGARYHLTAVGEVSGYQAQIIFTDGPDNTNVTVSCTPNPVPSGGTSTCTAEVDDTAGKPIGFPQGAVKFSLTTGAGTWSPSDTCTLVQIGNTMKSNCTATLTPTAAGTVKAQYNANPNSWSNGNATSSFTISAPSKQISSVTVGPQVGTVVYGTGGSATYLVTVSPLPNNTAFAVNLASGLLPTGVSGSFSSSTLNFTASAAAQSVTLTLTATVSTGAISGVPFTITATNPALSGDTQSGNGSFTINKATASVTPAAASKTYGQADPTLTGTLAGFLTADGVTATYSRISGETVAGGPYTISATLSPAGVLGNYEITYNTASFTINKADITIAGNNTSFTYGGTMPTLTAGITGMGAAQAAVDGITPTATTTATSSSPVAGSPYTITVGYNDPSAKAGNYIISLVNAQLTINKAPLTITSANKSMLLNGTLPAFTVTYSGFVNSESSAALGGTLACSANTSGQIIGAFTIFCSGQTSTNYNITYQNTGKLTVTYALVGGVCAGDLGHQILQPINAAGSSVFNGKSTTPAKFRVCDAKGASIGTPGVVSSFVVAQVINGTASDQNEVVDSTTPDTTFRWDPTAQQWIFNISNKSFANSKTYGFLITLNDGSTIPFQYGIK
jgi:hypothetical protein